MTLSSETVVRVVIPARYGSSRLPGKPLIDLGGIPMVVRVHQAVHSALPELDIIVAADDVRIMAALDEHNILGVLTRTDHESGTDRTAEVARLRQWGEHDVVINVQGDEPLIPADLLQAFAGFCKTRVNISMATVAVPLDSAAQIHDSNIVKLTLDGNDRAITFSRAALPFNRDLPSSEWQPCDYLRHVGIYAYRNSTLQRLTLAPPCALERIEKLEQLRAQWLGIPIDVLRWHYTPPHGVDTPEDAARVSRLFQRETQ